ncbi:hypothetical protein N789_14795 [Arenimonas oryziterrae DSM 21050 = YC6267]|uniref:Uncharacterized protein n=1 Tax=Arenimonas oryziterrae DSM 21050 = YC6267 TaxID=1121015 RepID=A0A091AQE7_9GAMM|nr:hypothetical protein N789_14795 [Arenimonas oryziterrae DSM 21050 = YC6267]
MFKYFLSALLLLSWAAVGYAALHYASACLIPTECLDMGEAFDYVAWECSQAEVPPSSGLHFIRNPVFFPLIAVTFAASVVTVLWRRYRRT